MKNTITPCFWFNNEAEKAIEFYTSVFKKAEIGQISRYGKEGFEQHQMQEGTLLTAEFKLFGQKFIFLNGGPHFKLNPSISFFVICDSIKEVDEYWEKLIQGGMVMMPINKYDWSERYAFLQDQFGICWQLFYGKFEYEAQKIVPSLMFTGTNAGKAEEAIQFYTSLFQNSSIKTLDKYTEEEDDAGNIKHAQFNLGNNIFSAMDSSMEHNFNFNEAISLMIECENQKEIDYFWNTLTEEGEEGMCGWLKDKYGLSWQVVPAILGTLMNNPEKAGKVTQAFMQMKKLEVDKLVNA